MLPRNSAVVLDVTWSLGLIGDDAADKVWLGAAQVGHQLIQVFLERDRHNQEASTEFQLVVDLAFLTGVVGVMRRGASTDLK